MENFVLYDEIYKSDEQTIFKARRKGTIKFLAISRIDKKKRLHVTNHVRFARALKHERILKFYEWYETSNHLWVVMDLCTAGTLDRMMREDKYIPESAIADIGYQLLDGLQVMHSAGIIFADWFPTRIFLDGRGNIKYFDFSYARMETEKSTDILLTNGYDNLELDGLSQIALPYIAPEIINGIPASPASDIWGLGCIFFKMFFGVTPFASQVPAHLKQMICNRKVEIPYQCNQQPSDDLWNLLCAMLTKDASKRITLKDAMNHPFWKIKSTINQVSRKLSICQEANNNNVDSPPTSLHSFASEVDKKVNGNFDDSDKTKNTTESVVKHLKRSVSMGDSALASAALLRDKAECKKASQLKHEETLKAETASAQVKTVSNNSTVATNNSVPVGDANFTLHAQACPVSLRPEVFDNAKMSLNGSSNDDSMDISSRSASKVFATPDCTKRTFFESNDSLQQPNSPMPVEERMTKSEYVFRNSDTPGQMGSTRLNNHLALPDKASPRASAQIRAKIALIYPWGDDAPSLPQEIFFPPGRNSTESENLLVSDELDDFNVLQEAANGKPSSIVYIPQSLDDYDKWLESPPKQELKLPSGLTFPSASTMNSLTCEDITDYSSKLLTQMLDPRTLQDSKYRPLAFLSYVAWFLSVNTLEPRQEDSPRSQIEASLKAIIMRIKSYLSASASLLRLDTVSALVKTRLCRILALLLHRSACLIQRGRNEDSSMIHLLIVEICPELVIILSTLVNILRDPAFRGVFSLKQAGIITMGEVIICEMCIYGRVLLNPLDYDDLSVEGLDISKEQWQSVLPRIIRSLSPGSPARSANSASLTAQTRFATTSVNEDTFRLAAACALNEVIATVIGCKLMRLIQRLDIQRFDRNHPGVQLAIAMSASINSFFDCLLTPETVSRVWADGIIGGGGGGSGGGGDANKTTSTLSPPSQQVAQACAGALAGLIRLRPSLFMCGLVDRNGTTDFRQKLIPASNVKEGQSTAFVANLLSATAMGLLLPLSFHGKPLGASLLRVGMKSGTPAACRRLLNNPRFLASILRQLESPHVMLRAKAYLLVAGALDAVSTSCSETLIAAFDARLPSCLERDLRMTNQHYMPKSALEEDGVLIEGGEDDGSRISTFMSPGLLYLGMCVKHLSDLMVHSLIPNICKQVAVAIGACGTRLNERTPSTKVASGPTAKSPSIMTSSTYQDRPKRTVSSAGAGQRTVCLIQGVRPSTATSSGVSLKTCLPAFSCLPGILASCASVRYRLLLPPSRQEMSTSDADVAVIEGFCLIEFISKIIDYWATSMGNLTSVQHHSASAENQLLRVTLTLAEDISRQLDVVEGRRADLIKSLLPAIARLAVAPASDSITRTICVKIILDMRNVWCGGNDDTDSVTSSNISLNIPKSPSGRISAMAYSPLSNDRLNSPCFGSSNTGVITRNESHRSADNRRPASAVSSGPSARSSSRVSSYRPSSFYGRSSSGVSSLKGYRNSSNIKKNLQGPSPEILLAVVDIVNNLLLPYASPLLDLRDVSPSPYFLRLLVDCLQTPYQPLPSCTNNNHLALLCVLHSSNFLSLLMDFIVKCNCASYRFSIHSFLSIRLLSILASQYPQESGIIEILINRLGESTQNPISIAYDLLISLGGSILKHERHGDESTKSAASCRRPILLKISPETKGIGHLLEALDLLTSLLHLVTDVVRYALHCRQGGSPADLPQIARLQRNGQTQSHQHFSVIKYLPKKSEDICTLAERLLSACRPPKHLPGVLASFLEASTQHNKDCEPLNGQTEQETHDLSTDVVALSTSVLAGLATLYGGEYCRTALSAAGLRGFATALHLRSEQREGTRLLLRILRRLAESDEICRHRLAGPAAKPLQSAIWKLRTTEEDDNHQDSVTIRLARSLLELLHPHPSTPLM